MSEYNATIQERGNGFPSDGDYVPGDDGNLYRVVRTSRIHTGAPGTANYVHAVVDLADWSDVADEDGEGSDDEAFQALAVLGDG